MKFCIPEKFFSDILFVNKKGCKSEFWSIEYIYDSTPKPQIQMNDRRNGDDKQLCYICSCYKLSYACIMFLY